MANMLLTTIQVLITELAGVGICAGVLYVYWNLMTKNRK